MINWITPAGILVNDYEENEIKDVFVNVEASDVSVELISGSLPEGISLYKVRDGRYGLQGILPIVPEETTYYFTLRAFNDEEYLDRYFGITIKNKVVSWSEDQTNEYTFSESAYVSQQLQLENATGEETFIKLNGEMPEGLSLNNTGLIYGIVGEVPEELNYYFTIGVLKNNQIILEKDFTFTIVKLSSLKDPIWITEAGLLGSLNYNDKSEMFVKAYDPNGLSLIYKLGTRGSLPKGLTLNSVNGRIEGQLKSEYTADWGFNIIIDNGLSEVSRDFMIVTNTIANENDIVWASEPMLGNFKVGENILIKIETKSKFPVVYSLLSSNLPKGLSFNNRGELIGVLDYQDYKTYSFVIEANNGYKTIQREFTMDVKKGLGKNALKCYYYINHEYDNEYNNLVGEFDRTTAFDATNPLYKLNPYPEIDICTLTCFDKTLLKQMLYFNEPINITWEKTLKKNYIQNDEIVYSAFYKSMREEPSEGKTITFKGNKVYITPSKDSPTGYINEYTGEPIEVTGEIKSEKRQGKRYVIYLDRKIYIDVLNSNNYYEKESLKVVDTSTYPIYIEEYLYREEIQQREYIVKDGEKYEVVRAEDGMIVSTETNEYFGLNTETTDVFYDPDIIRYYFIDSNTMSISYASSQEIRNVLATPIYVEKNTNNNVLYDIATQEIVSENEKYPEYFIKWDDRTQTYYAEYNGEKIYMDVYTIDESDPEKKATPVYASWERSDYEEDLDGGIATTESFEDINNGGDADTENYKEVVDANYERYVIKPVKVYTEYLNTDVDYKQYLVYEKGTRNLQEGILFTLSWNLESKFIIKDGRAYQVEVIDRPWMYAPELNENIGYNQKIVLPYISDDDVNNINGKPFIKFFDKDAESLPAWKSKTIPEWQPATSYVVGDVFVNNGLYYTVVQNFVSTNVFDISGTRKMTDVEVAEYQKTYYFPTLDLFYGRPNTNLIALSELNVIEEKGGFWTGRKFVFFEAHFKPMYNSNIDNFSIDFYNHKNNRTPEFQLI